MSGRNSRSSWHTGFFMVVGLSICVGVFLAVSAGRQAESDGWGYSIDSDSGDGVPSGFVVVDMSSAFVAMRNNSGDPGPTGIGPLFSEPMYEEGDLILDEVLPDDPKRPSLLQRMDKGDREKRLTLVDIRDSSGTVSSSRKDQSPGKVDVLEGVTLDEVSVAWVEHTVRSGQTLFDLAKNAKVTQEQIAKANGLTNPDRLSLGQVLLIPNTPDDIDVTLDEVRRRKEERLAIENKLVPLETKTYTVKNGDSLWSIANEFNVTIDTLFGANDLRDPDRLKPGVTLKVPNQDGLFYKVKKGDNLGAISTRYSVDIDKIVEINGVDPKRLSIGQELFLPGASQVAVAQGSSRSSGRSTTASSRSSSSFRWPVVGRINSPFGWRRHPLSKRRSFHTGVDIKGARHTKIRAAKAGTVVHSGWMGAYGRVVVIKHDNKYSTLYAHCQQLYVRKGQKVSAGAVIASVGTSGRSTGPHLHFEVRVNNKPDNPLKYLR
ncbi:LysM peptidoglycan-binding domain-containing protein [Dethiosulfovibrio salsuginis]|uniref:Murein DD-endopeptidase MepM and murein hydrolase activator NlpD, contain LysM domain n=1 Tax=Dethiosulfovibrio salsuginis TaxID=561720 RepID=A0A1X7K612_9BACT|nr:LysM peptidoglycan-binding domain-containing protein [Dethiosulfovibrio salsuginis]SMG36092.1 Murein DD-endopeptidase MepM and murein hydrolase activator NlpD, contain LysM domain [Dethiosulfovibrio salsuginis]